jgi:hypothetical protein
MEGIGIIGPGYGLPYIVVYGKAGNYKSFGNLDKILFALVIMMGIRLF